MYLIIRCPGCGTFTYIDRFQKWKLCPLCGETVNAKRVSAYLEVNTHQEAESIIHELEKYLKKTGKADISADDKKVLGKEYTHWVRTHSL